MQQKSRFRVEHVLLHRESKRGRGGGGGGGGGGKYTGLASHPLLSNLP